MNKILNLVLLLTSLSLTSCGMSKVGKNIGESISGLLTETTYDAHGTYVMESSNTDDITIQIVNEGGFVIRDNVRERDYTRVFAIIERNDFTAEELSLFSKHNINLKDVAKLKTRLVIGSGNNNSEVSHYKQLEKESSISLRTTDTEVFSVGDSQIEYVIKGVLNRDTLIFKGTIEVVINKYEYDNINGSVVLKIDSKIIAF